MKNVIPFNKEILFKTNIAEISSISLEHDYEIVEKEIKGNFIVSGDYKAHEVSVNKEPFHYALPFAIDLDDNIDKETISLDIEDFSYDFHDDVLEVKIEFSLCAEKIKEEERQEVEESIFQDPATLFGEENQTEELESLIADLEKQEQKQKELNQEIESQELISDNVTIEEKEEIIDEETKNIVMDSIDTKEEYVIYHVHILKSEETIESVCKNYDVTTSLVGEYNDLSTIEVGDKLIIPIYKDE